MEIEESDLIIKVLDASSDNIDMHLETIKDVFSTLNISNKLELVVFNKIDLMNKKDAEKKIEIFRKKIKKEIFAISAQNHTGLKNFKKKLISYGN